MGLSQQLTTELLRIRQITRLSSICARHHLGRLNAQGSDADHSRAGSQEILDYLKLRVETVGLEKIPTQNNFAVVANHCSYLDWAVLLAAFPKPLRFIAKKELTYVPFVGKWLRQRGVLIDRRRGISAKIAIRDAVKDDMDWPIVIFPEGTRSPDGSVQRFRRGGLVTLVQGGLNLLPVCIVGTFEALPRQARTVVPGRTLKMIVGDVIDATDRNGIGITQRVEQVIRELHREHHESIR